ncbi:exodeoxyribonuclease VII small subunit [Anaerotardibacter muris]|uniref:exodeoxyribonuclease VII small subunit n=1 Tax=Anaerotardibacter muris TaxID=2941505 RepID=UPI00203D7AA1|nr:exodeoxyribonuclease VII small subunit [Anaerotardibacter muris]
MTVNDPQSFEDVKGRLDQIVEAVSDESIPLDDALKLYEEAVELGLIASSLLEENLAESNARYDEEGSDDPEDIEDAEEASQVQSDQPMNEDR